MHEITLLQGLSSAALVFVLGIDFWLEALFLFRPIIVCTLTGAILGDIQTGLITGGLTELAFAGLTPAGGVQPPNPIMAGLMTTVIAWSTGVDAKNGNWSCLPFSLLMQYVILFFYSAFSLFMTKADKCAKEADTAAFSRLNLDNDAHRRFSVCGDCFPLYLPGTRGDASAGESDARG